MSDAKRPNINRLGLKSYPLHRLRVGKSAMVGPYTAAKTVGTMIARTKQRSGCESRAFWQRKVIIVDPVTGESMFMWIVTRIQ